MGRSSAPPELPRAPPDKHIVGGLLQARILWDGRQEEESDEDWQEEDVKVVKNCPVSKLLGPAMNVHIAANIHAGLHHHSLSAMLARGARRAAYCRSMVAVVATVAE